MSRPINAALVVGAFSPTGNPGEYTFEDAVFNNQADATGNGAYDVVVGSVLYVPATDSNTAAQLSGIVHRYKLTSVTATDPTLLSGTMVWDELGVEETEVPTNGIGCLLAEPTPNLFLGRVPSDVIYPDVPFGTTVLSMLVDNYNIVDRISGGSGPTLPVFKTSFGDGSTLEYNIAHGFETYDVTVTVFDGNGNDVICGIQRASTDEVILSFTEAPLLHRVLIKAL